MAAHETLLRRVGRQGVGTGQIGDLEAVAAVVAAADLGADGHAAVVAHVFVSARYGVEEGGLAAVRIADERHGDLPAAAGDDLVGTPAAVSVVDRLGECRVPHVLFGEQPLHLGVGEHDDHLGFAPAQRNVVPHDPVFDRIPERGVEHDLDPLIADEPHLHDAAAESAVSRNLQNRGRFSGFQFGKTHDRFCFSTRKCTDLP